MFTRETVSSILMHIDPLCFQQQLETISLHSEDQREIGPMRWICNFSHSTLSLSSSRWRHLSDGFRLCAELAFRASCQAHSVAKPSTPFQASQAKGVGLSIISADAITQPAGRYSLPQERTGLRIEWRGGDCPTMSAHCECIRRRCRANKEGRRSSLAL